MLIPRATILVMLNPYSLAFECTQSRTLLINRSGDVGSFGAAGQSPVPGISKLLARKPKDAFGQLDEARALYEPFPKTDSKATVSSIKAAICLVKMGEAAGQMGKPVLAETYFRRSLISVEPHVAQSTDREALFTAAAAYAGLANLEARRAQGLMASQESRRDSWVAAEAWNRKSLGAWKRIGFPDRETPLDLDFGEPTTVAKNLERCESALLSIR